MGPKKNKLTASTPAVAHPSATFAGIADNSGPSTINESSSFVLGNVEEVEEVALKQPAVPKVSALDLIFQAIETVGVPKKGASYQSIQKWILNNKDNVKPDRFRPYIKKAFTKALESGMLKRPKASKDTTGLRGYFIVNKEMNVQKNTGTKTAKPPIVKAKALKVQKTKTAKAPKPKVEETDTEEEASAKPPKTKTMKSKEKATSPKPKKTAKSKSDPEEEKSAKSKAGKSKSDSEEVTSVKPKSKAGKSKSDSEEATGVKPKSKAGKSKSDSEEATNAKPKTKAGKPKPDTSGPSGKGKAKTTVKAKHGPKAIAANIPDTGPTEELSLDEIPKKALKNTSKPTKSVKVVGKDPRSKKLYSSRINPATNISRKDLSDTELNVRPDNRKSLKSYSSDTEVEVSKRKKVAKGTKQTKIADAKKVKEAGPSKTNTKKQIVQDETF